MFQSLNNVIIGILWRSLTEKKHSFTTNSFLEGYVIWTQSFGVKLGNHLGKNWLYKSQYNFCNRTCRIFILNKGTGFTPEGLTDSYITTELMSEMSWRTEPVQNMTVWISQYLSRRYGKFNENALKAWSILSEKVLNSNGDHFNQKVLLVTMPSLHKVPFTN